MGEASLPTTEFAVANPTGLTVGDSSGHDNDLTLTMLAGGTLPVWFAD